MGRHSAADGASIDPVVAAALARRQPGDTARRRARDEPVTGEQDTARLGDRPLTADGTDGGLGWPVPPDGEPSPGGLGWPGDLPEPARRSPDLAPGGDEQRSRGWRRFFRAA